MSQVILELLTDTKANQLSIRHQRTLLHHLHAVGLNFSGFIHEITTPEINRYLRKIKNPKTRTNHRVSLVRLFNFAKQQGYLTPGQPTAADASGKVKLTPKEPVVLSPETMQALLTKAEQDNAAQLVMFLALGAFAGIRSAEIQRLTWGDIRESGIHLGPAITKTNRRRLAEIPDNLRTFIEKYRKDSDIYVTYQSARYLYLKLNALGISIPHNGLRHSFVSYHLELHRDPPRTAKTSGHSLAILESVYLKLVERPLAQAWFSICSAQNLPLDNPTTST